MEKVEFLKTLIRDITADERKSWADYAKMFEGGKDSEYPRSIWKRFKNQFYKDGLWTPGVPIDTIWREQVDTVMSVLEITPRAEDNEVVMTALKPNGQIMSIQEYCDTYNIPVEQVKSCKLVTHNGKGAYYNIQSKDLSFLAAGEKMSEFAKALLKDLSELKTLPKTIQRESITDGHLLVVDPADIHIGKLALAFETGEEYNNQIAVQRVHEGVDGLIQKSRGFNIEKILFVGGNDILHIDTPRKTTTSGTFQDCDGAWYSNFLIAKQLYVDIITKLLQVADVHFIFNPSNHDWMSGFFLADVIKTYFKDVKNITFDTDMNHRKYFRYGKNLIGTTHGDGAKEKDLGSLMSVEAKQHWAEVDHRYYYTHHIHHKESKDYINVTVETLRSPSGTDGWHSRNGYQHAPKAVEGLCRKSRCYFQ